MGSAWSFPTSLNIGGAEYALNTDYRAILDVFTALNDPELTDSDDRATAYMQSKVILEIIFPESIIPYEHTQEALDKVSEFINMGISDERKKPKLMDWDKDAHIIIPAVNKVLNCEIRALEYMHWWTFLGAYMEIGESLFANVIHIRQKKAKNQKLEKWEQEFYNANKSLIDLEQEEKWSEEEKNALDELFYGYKKKQTGTQS